MRIKFICHMLLMMSVMLGVAISIQARFYTQMILWGLFVYIIAKELLDEFREGNRPDKEAKIKQQIFDKLTKATEQIKKIV